MTISSRLTIFEGPDGGGKSTAARRFAEKTGARYVHCGSFKNVQRIGRFYVEAMLPALLGYQDVVMDRCWLSEKPYGDAFRQGHDRLGVTSVRALERLAFRCSTLVVWCLPPYDRIRSSFMERKQIEMLEDESQLKQVDTSYRGATTSLPSIVYDYTRTPLPAPRAMDRQRSVAHGLDFQTAGNHSAPIALVGEGFSEPKDGDCLYQWPFGSMNHSRCSHWLTQNLEDAGISESSLFWVNSDQGDHDDMREMLGERRHVVALGAKALTRLTELDIDCSAVEHPQSWKRFKSSQPYPLGKLLADDIQLANSIFKTMQGAAE